MTKSLLVSIFFLALISCGNENARIRIIKEKSGIDLPEKFETLRNESIDAGSADGDFSVYIDLRFDEESFKSLKDNIEKSNGMGVWTKTKGGLMFYSTDQNEPTTIEINDSLRTLKFEMHHI
jgi:hypothetical protein